MSPEMSFVKFYGKNHDVDVDRRRCKRDSTVPEVKSLLITHLRGEK